MVTNSPQGPHSSDITLHNDPEINAQLQERVFNDTSDNFFETNIEFLTLAQVETFNRQLERFGLSEQAIKVMASNNIHGHLSWRVLIEKEAYVRHLQKGLLPTQYWSKVEQTKLNVAKEIQQRINEEKETNLKRFNFNTNYYNQKQAFIREQISLLGYINFLKALIAAAALLLGKQRDREAFKDLIRMINQDQIDLAKERSDSAEYLAALEMAYKERVAEIDEQIQSCETQLVSVRNHIDELHRAIDGFEDNEGEFHPGQRQIVAAIQQEIQDFDEQHHEELQELDVALEENLALQSEILKAIEIKEDEKLEEEGHLSKIKFKREKIINKQAEMENKIIEIENMEQDAQTRLDHLTDKEKQGHITPAEREQISELQRALLVMEGSRFVEYSILEEEEEILKGKMEKYNKRESETYQRIGILEEQIKDLRVKLSDAKDEYGDLMAKKQAILKQREILANRLVVEQDKLDRLTNELKNAEEQEHLLVENIRDYQQLKTLLKEDLDINKRIAELEEKRSKIDPQLKESAEELKSAKKAVSRVNNALNGTLDENGSLVKDGMRQKLSKMQAELSELEEGSAKYNKKQKQISKLEGAIKGMEKNLETQEARLEAAAKSHKEYSIAVEKIELQIESSAYGIIINKNDIQKLQQKIANNESRRQTLERTADSTILMDIKRNVRKVKDVDNADISRNYSDIHQTKPQLRRQNSSPTLSYDRYNNNSSRKNSQHNMQQPPSNSGDHPSRRVPRKPKKTN